MDSFIAIDVKGSQTFKEAYQDIINYIDGNIIVSHTGFDRASLSPACKKYDLPDISIS